MIKPFRFIIVSNALISAILAFTLLFTIAASASSIRVTNGKSPLSGREAPNLSTVRTALPVADGVDETIIEEGDVTGTWTADGSPYRVQGNITVPEGGSLTIESGVEVIFDAHYQFTVEGMITAIGTESDIIVFTAGDELIGWGGMRLVQANTASRLEYCLFTFGNATGDWPDNCGGAIYLSGAIAAIKHCQFINNRADKWGGAIYLWSAAPEFSYNLFSQNRALDPADAPYGHAMYIGASEGLLLNHLTITGNEVDEGFALYTAMGVTLNMSNSILWDTYEMTYLAGGINYSDIAETDNTMRDGMGVGNINQDPRFNDPENLDFVLRPNSPCIDAAAPNSPFQNEPQPNGNRANIGADGNSSLATESLPLFSFDSDVQVLEIDAVDFDRQKIDLPDTLTQTIYNVGRQALEISSFNFTNEVFSSNFDEIADTVTHLVHIGPDSSATMQMIFTPDAVEDETGALTFTDNDTTNETVEIDLLGTGIDPVIELDPDNFVFGSYAVGDTVWESITITNNGSNQGGIFSDLIIVSVVPIANFTIWDEDSLRPNRDTLAVGESIEYIVFFSPEEEGVFSDSMEIQNNAGYVYVQFSGTGLEPIFYHDPDSLEYGVAAIGEERTLEFEIWNSGSVPLELTDFIVSNPDFIVDAPQTTVGNHDTVSVSVTFQPSAPGIYTETLEIETNENDPPIHRVYLFGTGTSQTNYWIGEVGDTTWTADESPYYIVGGVTIPNEETLTIEPGVEVRFEGDFSFEVRGTLDAQGTSTDPIEFSTINETDSTWSGIYFTMGSSESVVRHCIMHRGATTEDGVYGGVVRVENSAPVIDQCEFYDNSSSRGGALALLSWSQAEVSDCYFHDNTADLGGAVYAGWFAMSTISDCEIEDNSAVDGGGVYLSGAAGSIQGCVVHDNTASGIGGGVFFGDGATTELSFNEIGDNSAADGGGVAIRWFSKPYIHDEVIYNNTASGNGGGIFILDGCTPLITEILIAENNATLGQAIYSSASGSVISYCTLVGNSDTDDGWVLTAINGDQTMISNSIIGAATWPNTSNHPICATGSEITVTYSDVLDTNSTLTYEGLENVNIDPEFVGLGSTVSEQYQLDTNSPVLDHAEGGGEIGFTGGNGALVWDIALTVVQNPVINASMNFMLTSTVPLLTAPYMHVEQDLVDTLEYVPVDSAYMIEIAPLIYTVPLYQSEEGRPTRAIFSYSNILGEHDSDTLDFVATQLSTEGSAIGLSGDVTITARAVFGTGMWGIISSSGLQVLPETGLIAIGSAYEVFAAGVELQNGRIEFVLHDDVLNGLPAENCAVAFWNGDEWETLPSYLSDDMNIIWASLEESGSYRVVWGENLCSSIILPSDITLSQNYPNPFNPETVIEFALPETESVKLEIFNLMGRTIATLVDGRENAGYHKVRWNGLNQNGMSASSGIYFYRLRAGDQIISKKMILLR